MCCNEQACVQMIHCQEQEWSGKDIDCVAKQSVFESQDPDRDH